ncbi:zeta toxin family protein [Chitinophaga sp. HK235]|uniref:zeta toxin family protein n=1 Tax=Chitinophaga sp. HK235 TaxID=2952571 RepID=UPI002013187A|nr:zeta toxin family protein [Chitinophaga sp. HK235]
MEAGKLMLKRIHQLLEEKEDFAFETTLATRSYKSLVEKAKKAGYKVVLLYFWLSSPALAKERVANRVKKGGHNIPPDVIERRYYRGIHNLTALYIPVCDEWIVVRNEDTVPEEISINSKKREFEKLSDKVMKGMKIALRRLVEKSAANNEELVIGDKNGQIKVVQANDLLSSVQ